ncbi:acyltransferase family protein [uncultured Parabacteroides sp.]|uniref:acyltransferase family protein n=1 Tax=uncultured Parabacteroides sp. TaxID=512312 RepID=UPI0026DC7F3D|nr:acyltransferase family protein [uncultured Parabacteroides sp.]
MRDRNLDIYRGGIRIYITCFSHLVWWEGAKVGIFDRGWVSAALFSMAIIFYIAGASFSLTSEKPYWVYIRTRVKKIVIPYWKYALFCFPAVCFFYRNHGGIMPLKDFLSYVLFTPPVEHRIFDHLWFLSPYLLISLFLPMLFNGIRRYKIPFIFYAVCVVLLLSFNQYYSELIQTAIVYMLFTVWGLYYKQNLGWQNIVCVIAAAGYLVYMFGVEKIPFDIQANKFPPNLLFVSYCMVILGLGGSYMKKGIVSLYDKSAIVRRYIDIYSKEGYDIYFVHAFSTLLLGEFKRVLGLNQIIADHLILQLVYVVVGFLLLLNVNVYVLRLYNYVWFLINRAVKVVFPASQL